MIDWKQPTFEEYAEFFGRAIAARLGENPKAMPVPESVRKIMYPKGFHLACVGDTLFVCRESDKLGDDNA